MDNISKHQKMPTKAEMAEVFTGREIELNILQNQLKNLFVECGGFTIVSGEAGIGKSFLIDKFRSQVSESTVHFLEINFNKTDLLNPYEPILEAIRSIFPEISVTKNISEEPLKSLYFLESKNNIIQQQITADLIKLSTQKPIILNFTNIHQAPPSLWQFFHFLRNAITNYPILMLASLRHDGRVLNSEKIPHYASMLDRMNKANLIQWIELRRFTPDEIKTLLRGIFQKTDFTHNIMPLITELSDNKPDKVIRVIRSLVEQAIIYREDDIWFNEIDLDFEKVKHKLYGEFSPQYWTELIESLPQQAKRVLRYCAIMEGQINIELLAAATGIKKIKILHQLNLLCTEKLLHCKKDDQFNFKYSEIRKTLLNQISTPTLRGMHKKLMEALQEEDELSPDIRITLLAHHAFECKAYDLAGKYLLNSAKYAIKNSAIWEAREYLQKFADIKKSHELNDISHEEYVQAQLELAWLTATLGYRKDSILIIDSIFSTGTETLSEKLQGQAIIQKALCLHDMGEWRKSVQILEELHQSVHGEDFQHELIHYGLGMSYFELGDYSRAQQNYKIAFEIAESADMTELQANIHNNMAVLSTIRGNYLQAISQFSKSIPLYRKSKNKPGLAKIFHNLGMAYAALQKWDIANDFYSQSLSICDKYGLLPLKSLNFLNRSYVLAKLKDINVAKEYLFKAQRILRQLNDKLGLAEYYKIMGVVDGENSDFEMAFEHLKIAKKMFQSLQNKLGCAETNYEMACIAWNNGELETHSKYLQESFLQYNEIGLSYKVDLLKDNFVNN